MTVNVSLTPVVAMLLAALAGESVVSADAREEPNCLAAPGTQAPPGRHWFYRIDRPKQRKCWYLRAQGAAETTARAPIRHRLRIASTAPEARLPSPPDRLVPEIRLEPQAGQPVAAAPDDRMTGPGTKDGVQVPSRTDADIAAGPLVSAPVASGTNVALSAEPADDRAGRAAQGAAERIRQAHAVRVAAAQPDAHALAVGERGEEAAEPIPAAASGHVAPLAFVFAGAMLVIAGIFLHPIVQIFARRPVFQPSHAAPAWRTSMAREWKMPGFLARWRDVRPDRREYNLDEI